MPSLAAATDIEKKARDPLTHAEWGQGLSSEQWLEREALLRAHPWSVASMETWFWRGDDGQTLASCETFRTPARVGEDTGAVFAVASVFTAPALRGKGHATAMIDAVNLALAKRPDALGSVLFSDVGARIYERSGYRAFPAVEWVLPPLPGDPESGTRALEDLRFPALGPSRPGELALLPRREQLDWHVERERFYAHAAGKRPAPFHAAQQGAALVTWMGSFKENALRVLTLEPGTPQDTLAVVQTAQRMAGALGLASVRVWEPHPGFVALPGERRPREGELPMAKLYRHPLTDWRHIHRAVWV